MAQKFKFNIIVNKVEEPYTGIFYDQDGIDAYTRAVKWYNKHGIKLKEEGKNLVFRECLINGEVINKDLPQL